MWQKGKKFSPEHVEKLRKTRFGNKSHTGLPAWNKGIPLTPETKSKLSISHKGKYPSEETRRKMSISHMGNKSNLGKHLSEKTRKKLSIAMKARKLTEIHRKRMSEANKGEKSHFWKGGIAPINNIARQSLEYKIWRESVFKRDDWTCVFCGKKGGRIHADHIKPFATHLELRYSLENGRTLCISCHKQTDTYAGRTKPKKTASFAKTPDNSLLTIKTRHSAFQRPCTR